jgi:hypothetical protein
VHELPLKKYFPRAAAKKILFYNDPNKQQVRLINAKKFASIFEKPIFGRSKTYRDQGLLDVKKMMTIS